MIGAWFNIGLLTPITGFFLILSYYLSFKESEIKAERKENKRNIDLDI